MMTGMTYKIRRRNGPFSHQEGTWEVYQAPLIPQIFLKDPQIQATIPAGSGIIPILPVAIPCPNLFSEWSYATRNVQTDESRDQNQFKCQQDT